MIRSHVTLVLMVAAIGVPGPAWAQRAQLRVDRDGAHVGLPFTVAIVAEGFEETPPLDQPPLVIPGATVTPLGVQPNVQQRVTILNGQRKESRSVTFVARYQVRAEKPGALRIPPLVVNQGGRQARTEPATVTVSDVPSTGDMRIVVVLPDRPLSVGETVQFEIQWLIRRNVRDQSFSVPLLEMPEQVNVAPAPPGERRTLELLAGGRSLDLPYDRDQTTVGGSQFTRFRLHGLVTPLKEGKIELPPAQVLAQLEVGSGVDRFGFPSARTELFKAVDVPRTITVRPLPVSGRPSSFSGAVGTAFSIQVQASRSVVSRGEPVELTVTIRSDGRLDGLALPRLDGPDGLPRDLFSVPSDAPAGELSGDGKQKTFRVSVRVVGQATQIPPIPFSYFDPARNAYVTVKSQPIALSVQGGSIVAAADVVTGETNPPSALDRARADQRVAAGGGELSLVGADLSLSSSEGRRAVLSEVGLRGVLATLYLLPLLVLLVRLWLIRTEKGRSDASELRKAYGTVVDVLTRAGAAPGRETAGSLSRAIRELARIAGAKLTGDDARLLELIETEGFAPAAGQAPLPAGLRDDARALADRLQEGRPRVGGRAATTIVVVLMAVGSPWISVSEETTEHGTERARSAYQQALAEKDPGRRRAGFAESMKGFATAAREHPDRADLHDDWGNASLGAGELGFATLAYRRALRLDPSDERAARNLSWLRSRQPEWLPRPPGRGALDALFFWHGGWSRSTRHLVGAVSFALAVALVAAWPRALSRRRTLLRVAAVPGVVWIAMSGSLAIERYASSDAVVVQAGLTMRAADSTGAPPALASPLPAGAEVTVEERRAGWCRVRLANGVTGWLPDGAVARIDVR